MGLLEEASWFLVPSGYLLLEVRQRPLQEDHCEEAPCEGHLLVPHACQSLWQVLRGRREVLRLRPLASAARYPSDHAAPLCARLAASEASPLSTPCSMHQHLRWSQILIHKFAIEHLPRKPSL